MTYSLISHLFGPIGKVPWLGRPIQSAKYRNYTIEKE